jgi:uncharacterized membrane protein YfcA
MQAAPVLALLICAACGLASGFLAGLLGIGGGLIVVPAMLLLIPLGLGAVDQLPQVAAATSLAAMIPTTVTALLAQQRRGAVDAAWLMHLAPGACVGALMGAWLLPHLDARWVAGAFLVYAGYFALRLVLSARGRHLPAPWNRWPSLPVATAIGMLSVLAGVGGAVFTVPYLESRDVRMTRAVGTSSGIALVLSSVAVAWLANTAAAMVWWPAALVVGATAVVTAPLGVRQAHRWPVARLKRAFAWLLLFAGVGSLWKLVHF